MHRICAVFTQPDRPAGRGQPLHAGPVKVRAAQLGLDVYQPAGFKSPEMLELLRGLNLDALVVVAYGSILPAGALAVPQLGCINIHASLLPRWRGAAPIQRALLAGDTKTGVTIMRMEAGLDTGPMLAMRQLEIGARDTTKILHDKLAALGAELIVDTLDGLRRGLIPDVPQPADGVTYAEKIRKAEALIDWGVDAERVFRQVRAFNPWPIAETRLKGAQLRIWDAELGGAAQRGTEPRSTGPRSTGPRSSEPRGGMDAGAAAAPGTVLAAADDGIDVACGSGTLRILRLQLAGRKPLMAREFIKAQPLDGARFAQA